MEGDYILPVYKSLNIIAISLARCSNCKTIRVGGGYVVLDGDDENMKRGNSRSSN